MQDTQKTLNQKIRDKNMAKLTIVAYIKSNADKIDLVKAELLKLIDITRAEEGCINYDLLQDNQNPAHFLFYENWGSRELWQAHMGSQHLKDYMAATEGAVEEFVLNEMTPPIYVKSL
jgi:quinol monooxygenase YgiN